MRIAFLKVGKFLSFLWHTIVSMFVKKKKLKASIVDVTKDGIDDLVITTDNSFSPEINNIIKGEENHD